MAVMLLKGVSLSFPVLHHCRAKCSRCHSAFNLLENPAGNNINTFHKRTIAEDILF
jgi:hypothetical protein